MSTKFDKNFYVTIKDFSNELKKLMLYLRKTLFKKLQIKFKFRKNPIQDQTTSPIHQPKAIKHISVTN
jgi:hypothetical protein